MYSVIDIGSNTIRLVVYRVDSEGITAILNNKYTAGLAAYIGKDGALSDEGIERLVDVMGKFRDAVELLPGCEVFPFATASLRNVTNREEILRRVKEATGFDIRVLSGYEEAMLDYHGAVRSMPGEEGLLVDVGGGSTELVFFKGGRAAATVETTLVHFSPIVEDDLRAYVRTPEPYDKAGAYAIQGHAALWCAGIEGCYYNIMGLPVHRAAQLLREFA